MKIAVIISYYNRPRQLINTLKSIEQTNQNDFVIIVVDDNSKIKPVIETDLPVTLITMSKKYGNDGSPAYNTGLRYALHLSPDIFVIQNAECYHVGDVLTYAASINNRSYISFGTYCSSKLRYLNNAPLEIINRPAENNDDDAWFNHPRIRPKPYHWCCAITAENIIRLNGFDERFSDGYWYDDDYFLARIRMLGLNIEITESPYVVHQWHDRDYVPENYKDLINRNLNLFQSLMDEGNFRAVHQYTKDLDEF